MIQRVIEYSIDNRYVVIALELAVAAWGIYSLARTPIDAIPDLSENQVIVFADWMGRSPQEIEDQVTYPLSVNLQGLAGVKSVRATSEFNFSMIDVIFEDRVDFYFARQRVLERLTLAATYLPPGVVPYLAPDATALGQIYWYTVEGGELDLGERRAIQDWYVRYQLNAVPGVAQVGSVGGFVRSYEVAVDPGRLRAHGLTLGQVVEAVGRSNAAVGGNVLVRHDAEYLVRGVGWLRDLEDLRRVPVTARDGVPLTLGQVAGVQFAPEPRRAVLEKNGSEAVGGVVLMRHGENPREVTRRIEMKIAELQPGLPPGVRIVPFYDRTRLIDGAIHTLTGVLREEMIIAAFAVLLILTHLGSAFVVIVTLPLAVLVSFILMRLFQIPSNIMSLSGIAISIGVLVDAAIVMVENATHELTDRFGARPVRGDTREAIREATRLVGRPIFFSVLIMLLSFLPVFALSGQEGKMFHPLAFTKSFAMIGVALLAITLVPALLPIFLRGRLRSEMENPIVRSVIEIYRPVLGFLLRHPRPFVWSFVVLLGVGWVLARHLGREFMPPLDEGSVMDMPVTLPSVSVARAGEDLRVRDAVLRAFPEVESVVGKAGRADTPTDPAPPDMIETIVNLRPRSAWPKRRIAYDDARDEGRRVRDWLRGRGVIASAADPTAEAALLNDAVMGAVAAADEALRGQARAAQAELEPRLERALAERALADLERRLRPRAPLAPAARGRVVDGLAQAFGPALREGTGLADVSGLLIAGQDSLAARGLVPDRPDRLRAPRPPLAALTDPVLAFLGRERASLPERVRRSIERERDRIWRRETKRLDHALSDRAPGLLLEALATQLHAAARSRGGAVRDLAPEDLAALRAARERPLARKLFLWRKTKSDLVQEMDTALQVPGWGNIWTQPIVNRVDMLSTGVRTMVGVKVFGDDVRRIQEVSERVAEELRRIPGAVDVFPDQIVGENYVEIEIDRERAARYGVNAADVNDAIEVALGGQTVTTTVEGRRRFPVRVRYARDFRTDPDAIGQVLVPATGGGPAAPPGAASATGGGMSGGSGGMGGMSGGGAGAMEGMGPSAGARGAPPAPRAGPEPGAAEAVADLAAARLRGPTQVPLAAVADIRVVQGPSMIKSENGLLRSYVQLNVRGRDVVGFVEEAQRVIAERVTLPPGVYLEWSGQFEHQVRARQTLQVVFPLVIALILLILYLTFRDMAHALLMVLAVPGALAGGVIFQTLFGFNFSVAVWVGYIAAFGMATETGIVMMVYLRDAIRRRGGLAGIRDEGEIRDAVMEGAVHRLRPKLLTEGVAIVGLMPMLWAQGTGAEVMRPMVAPVLGGLLVADEVIDLLLPVLFHGVERARWRRMRARG
jgi:Cu(I)/Ag(I) efflux system membrane protein CusA/SilA